MNSDAGLNKILAIAMYMWLSKIFSKKKSKKVSEKKHHISRRLARIIEKLRQKQKEEHKIINKYEAKLEFLLQQKDYDFNKFNHVVRGFLHEFYGLKPSLTNQELKIILEHKKINEDLRTRLLIFMEKLDEIRYSTDNESIPDAKLMMEDFGLLMR